MRRHLARRRSTAKHRHNRAQRRRLALAFALVFGVVAGGPRAAHAREVPFGNPPLVSNSVSRVKSVHYADIDGDGDLDVISASNQSNTIAWHENGGGSTPAWTAHTINTGAIGAYSVFPADLDGDGDVDVLSASSSDGRIVWYENDGSGGGPWTAHQIATGVGFAESVVAADLDSDGDLDVVSVGFSGDVVLWHENSGHGASWTTHALTTPSASPLFASVADVDGDGDPDVLLTAADSVAWYENAVGDGVVTDWVRHTVATGVTSPYGVVGADVDGDGHVDIAVAGYRDGFVGWYENGAGGGGTTWSAHTIASGMNGPFWLDVADIDGDGDLDVVSASYVGSTVTWFENAGSGSAWSAHDIDTNAGFAISVRAVDLDGDGDVDVLAGNALASSVSEVAWYRNDTIHKSATFLARPPIDGGLNGASSVVAADVDGDGDLDSVATAFTADKLMWYENAGGGATSWVTHTIATALDGAIAAAVADVNGDGDLDMVVALENGNAFLWFENLGAGAAWTAHAITTSAPSAFAVATADVDGDGDLDVVGTAYSTGQIVWYENDGGGGTAWILHPIATLSGPNSVAVGDIDGDGDLDVVVSFHVAGGGEVIWYANPLHAATLSTVWAAHLIHGTALEAFYSVAVADVDGDGDLDVVRADLPGTVVYSSLVWYENKGAGLSWTRRTVATMGTVATGAVGGGFVQLADVDGDGDLDLVKPEILDSTIRWYENLRGSPVSWAAHTLATGVSGARWVATGDLDRDGDLDLLSAAVAGNQIAWHENRGGQFALSTTDTAPATIMAEQPDDVLRIDMTHRGRNLGVGLDHDEELTTLQVGIDDGSGAPMSTPLTTAQANSAIESLYVYRDTGNGSFDAGDALAATITNFSLTAGKQTISFLAGDTDVQVELGAPATFFLVVDPSAHVSNQSLRHVRLTHIADGSSAEDRSADIPLTLEYVPDASSGVVLLDGSGLPFSSGFEVGDPVWVFSAP